MEFETEDITRRLIEEVVEWTARDKFFFRSGSADSEATRVPISLHDCEVWFEHIDIDNEDSQFVELKDALVKINTAYRLVHQFGPEEFEDYVGRATERVGKHVSESKTIEAVASQLFSRNPMRTEWHNYLNNVCSIISHALSTVIHARALSASTRYAPTEALFQLYQQGLFPFAWDWDTLWCLDPATLVKSIEPS